VSQKNCAFVFLSELRQISTNYNNFWYVGGKVSEILCCICTATSPDPCHCTTLLNADVPNFYLTTILLRFG